MKRAVCSIFFMMLILGAAVFAFSQPTRAQYYETINSFAVAIDVSKDSSLTVRETIEYDFGSVEQHGIFRKIPYQYTRNGLNYSIRIAVQTVTDENGKAYEYSTSKSGGLLELKIGDPDLYVSGKHTYIITYSVARAINYFETHDELYWNATGDQWEADIEFADAVVTYPSNNTDEDIQTACYTGSFGSTDSDCTIDSNSFAQTVSYSADDVLYEGEGMSIVLGLPKGILQKPPALLGASYFAQDNWPLVIPLIIWIIIHTTWMKKGRDPKGRGTIIPIYEPPEGMPPAIMGALWDGKADTKDISASILFLAVKGYIKIKYLEKKNFEFIRQEKDPHGLDDVTAKVLHELFLNDAAKKSIELSDLKNKFYKALPDIKKNMYEGLVKRKYYVSNPNTVRTSYYTIGMIFLMLMFFGFVSFFGLVGYAACIVSAILVFIYGTIMPAKSRHGAEIHEEVEGFKWFLSVTEEERLKFHNAPEKKPELFEMLLPYAMVLGVENRWAKQFEGIYNQNPSWYEGAPGTVFNVLLFTSIMSTMNSSVGSTMTSRPTSAGSGGSGFGGGGFSGGGFGGGGGGSW